MKTCIGPFFLKFDYLSISVVSGSGGAPIWFTIYKNQDSV